MGRHTELQADTDVLVNTLNNMGTSWLIGNKLAFINVGETMLNSEFLELLPPRRIILDLSPRIVPSNELLSRARHLRSMGFGIALDDFSFESPAAAFLELANYVKLDIQNQDTTRFQMLAARLRSYPLIRIAERWNSTPSSICARNWAWTASGYYFARPETLAAKVIHPAFSNTLELLNLLRMDADIRDIEQVLKRDVALSYKLLRYVNSAAAGLNTTISSFSHAVTVLGYQKLYRWLTLLLVTASDDNNARPRCRKPPSPGAASWNCWAWSWASATTSTTICSSSACSACWTCCSTCRWTKSSSTCSSRPRSWTPCCTNAARSAST